MTEPNFCETLSKIDTTVKTLKFIFGIFWCWGLFTNIILKKTIYITVNIDIEKHLEIKISNKYLTELFNFPAKKKIFYLMNNFMVKMMVLQWVHPLVLRLANP